ncbi:MAG: GNAT family N-acetyltransferase [Desulfobacteraceae bacterium]|nr:GNAT family N-acetyltransferase [Desulfobacteraceae bacterium]
MRIERLSENDLVSLSEIFHQIWGEISSLEKMKSTFSRLKANPAYFLLAAKQDNELVGFAMGVICEELYGECKPFMVVEDVIVDQRQRQKGVGSALMRELEKYAKDCECCQIIFVTESNRKDALGFYNALGYEYEPYKGFKKIIK